MQNIHDIHDYDENFLDQITQEVLPIYDLWMIKPLNNEQKIFLSGKSDELKKFKDFILDHIEKDYPHPLMIVFGNSERNNPEFMLRNSRKYYKVQFNQFKGNENGQPLLLSGRSSLQGTPIPYAINRNQPGIMQGIAGMSMQDLQGIIDRNVSDAQRSIRAEYEEISAKREIESMKRLAELEMRIEMNRLERKEEELKEKERKLNEAMEELEEKRAGGLGNVKDYSKAIAGGLIELGKSAFGIDDMDFKKKDKENDRTRKAEKEDLKGSKEDHINTDDEGFTEQSAEETQENELDQLLGTISKLSSEQKYQLMDILIPEDSEEDPEREGESIELLNDNKEENEAVSTDDNNK